MDRDKVNIADRLAKISQPWDPHIIGELNGQYVKAAKLDGEFVFHRHEEEDELFLVIKGTLKMAFEDRTETIYPGEFIIVPKGVLHKPIAEEPVEVILFEPMTTLNTGNLENDFTKKDLKRI
jgi:mannose-6-phosphate isomerase-like protein (cupin superfamily)